MSTHILIRHDSAANFAAVNPVLLAGEFGFELDTRKVKAGNGVSPWNDLAYVVEGKITAEQIAKLDAIQAGAQVNTVISVFGRTGVITARSNDYTADMIADGAAKVSMLLTERQKLESLTQGVPASRSVTGEGGLVGGGPLGDGDVVLRLAGMPATIEANYYWGSNAAGVPGFYALPSVVPSPNEVPWQAIGSSTAFTALPSAKTEYANSTYRTWRDCTNVKHLRMSQIVTVSATLGQFAFEYAPGNSTTQPASGDWIPVTDLELGVQSAGFSSTDKLDIPDGAKVPCWWRLVGKNGDGTGNPAARQVTLWWDDSAAKGDKGDKGDPGDATTGGGSPGEVNVMSAPYSAACDGTTDDTIAIVAAATAIKAAGLGQILTIPRKTRLAGMVDLRGVSIRAAGDIIMSPGSTMTVGNNSVSPAPLTIELMGSVGNGVYTGRQETPYIRVIGKHLRVFVGRTPAMQLYADANAESASTSYNDISVGHCKKLGIIGVNSTASVGMVNENRIYCGSITYLDISSNSYLHNNNVISGGFEPYGTEPYAIVLDHCHSNHIHGRFEAGAFANALTCSATATNNRFTTSFYSLANQAYEAFNFPQNWVGASGALTDAGANNSFRYLGLAEHYAGQCIGVTAAQSATPAWTWMLDTREFVRIAPGDIIAYHFPAGGNWRAYLAIYNEAFAGLTAASGDVATHLDVIGGAIAWNAAPSGWEANSLLSGADITTARTVIAVVKPGSTARWARISIRAGSAVGSSSTGARAVIYRRGEGAGIAPSQLIAPATQTLAGLLSSTDKTKIDTGTGGGGGTGLPPAAQVISVSNTTITSTMVFCDPGCAALKLPLTASGLHEITFMNRSGATVTVTSTSPETINGMTSIDIPNGSWLKMRRAAPNWYEAPLG